MRYALALGLALVSLSFASSAAPAVNEPPGSYQRTCRDIYADWNVLAATCKTRRGEWNYTTLADYRDCDGDIANVNGRLTCTRDDDDDDDDGWVPRGSYQDTCRRIRVEDDTLMAECVDRNGRWRYTELQSVRSCRGDISNANGWLRCRRANDDDDGDDDDDGYDLPGGNWRASCRKARVYGSMLFAECRDRDGFWRQTSLDLDDCRGDVENRGGRLVCALGGYGRITLYKHTNFGGKSRTVVADVPDLNPAAFGNQASSAVVQGGVWELCDRPNYRGYCIIIDRTQANLWAFGFNDRTESVRRIR
jgi:hypothetical protein